MSNLDCGATAGNQGISDIHPRGQQHLLKGGIIVTKLMFETAANLFAQEVVYLYDVYESATCWSLTSECVYNVASWWHFDPCHLL